MRDRQWRRNQRERIIQKVLRRYRDRGGWLYSGQSPVPHLFYEREEFINQHPAIDHWFPPRDWTEVWAQRREDAVRRHGSRCPITYDWDKYEPTSLSVQRMDITEREQIEELNELF